MTLLTVNGIKKSFGGLKALNDVNLNVEEGTVPRGDWAQWRREIDPAAHLCWQAQTR